MVERLTDQHPTLTSSLGTGRTAVALSSGYSHTCAILDNGAVSCWGYADYGKLGNGGTSPKTTPTLTSSLGTGRTAVALSSGLLPTPAPSSTTVLCRAGDTDTTANWVMEEHLQNHTHAHQQPRYRSHRSVDRWRQRRRWGVRTFGLLSRRFNSKQKMRYWSIWSISMC